MLIELNYDIYNKELFTIIYNYDSIPNMKNLSLRIKKNNSIYKS